MYSIRITVFGFFLLIGGISSSSYSERTARESQSSKEAETSKSLSSENGGISYETLCTEKKESCEIIHQSNQKTNYSINLMWIAKQLDSTKNDIFNSPDEVTLKSKFLDPIFLWAEKNPKIHIRVWYDSHFVSEKSIKNTQMKIDEMISKNNDTQGLIQLTDLREIPLLSQEAEIFSEKTPLYFRADLLRIIATLYSLSTSKSDSYFVYADFDVSPMSKSELFDQETLDNLKKFGIVLTYTDDGYENSFHIVKGDNLNVLEAFDFLGVQFNLKRAKNVLNGKFETKEIPKSTALQQIVFNSYEYLLEYLFHLEGFGTLFVVNKSKDEEVAYKKEEYGLLPFCPNYDTNLVKFCNYGVKFKAKDPSIWDAKWEHIKAPMKKISLPPAKWHGYY